jgi:hypothetical protein
MRYMIAIRASPLLVYQGRPVLVAASLADLRGPTSGVVELPLRLYWSAPDRTFSLDDPAERPSGSADQPTRAGHGKDQCEVAGAGLAWDDTKTYT